MLHGRINLNVLFVSILRQAFIQSLLSASFAFAAASSLDFTSGSRYHSFIMNSLTYVESSPTVRRATKSAAALNLFTTARRRESSRPSSFTTNQVKS